MSMTASDTITDGQLVYLPPEAGDVNSPRFQPDPEWLESAEPTLQKAAMWRWFSTHYEDPDVATPHDGAGNYVFLDGGPFLADKVIPDRFEGFVPDDVIRELVHSVQAEAGNEWAAKVLDRFGG